MRKFETPEIEVLNLEIQDVTTSTPGPIPGENETDIG